MDFETRFDSLAAWAAGAAADAESVMAWYAAEASDFVRFNHGRVRQAGHVEQATVALRLVSGARHATQALTLTGRDEEDSARLDQALATLREVVPSLPDDPHLLFSTEPESSQRIRRASLATPEQAIEALAAEAAGLDLVGFYAAGPVCRGFASSLGHRHWHRVESFNLDWSLHAANGKAIKASYAGFEWSAAELAARMANARREREVLDRPPHRVAPGRYRAWLAPAAVNEICGLLGWGGFSGRAQRLGQSCLLRLQSGEASLAPGVSIAEHTAAGIAPGFQRDGFVRPGRVALVESGRLASALVSPRTAREFDCPHNGANGSESPEALDMAAGSLGAADVLSRLSTGLYVGNLWYLNFSDRAAGRLTGLTRFGTFWVERGEVVAPLEVMRFDDTIYRLLGEQLEALGAEREMLPETQTYGSRALASAELPGALVAELALTL